MREEVTRMAGKVVVSDNNIRERVNLITISILKRFDLKFCLTNEVDLIKLLIPNNSKNVEIEISFSPFQI